MGVIQDWDSVKDWKVQDTIENHIDFKKLSVLELIYSYLKYSVLWLMFYSMPVDQSQPMQGYFKRIDKILRYQH